MGPGRPLAGGLALDPQGDSRPSCHAVERTGLDLGRSAWTPGSDPGQRLGLSEPVSICAMGCCMDSEMSRWTARARQWPDTVTCAFFSVPGSLQLLEQQVVGGEQAKNKDLKERHKRRKRYADERKRQLVAALQNSDEDGGDWVLLNVYDSIQEEVRAKSKLLEKIQRKVRPQPCPPHPARGVHSSGPAVEAVTATDVSVLGGRV